MKKIIILVSCLASMQISLSQDLSRQSGGLDINSLLQKLSIEKNDNKRIDLINAFLSSTSEINPVLDMKNAQTLLLHSQKNKDKISEAMALSQIGYDYRAFGNSRKSLEYGLKSTSLAIETGNIKLIAYTQLNVAHNYKDHADYSKAINLYMSALEFGFVLKDDLLQLWTFNSLGQVYMEMNQLDSALMYSQRAYELCEKHDTTFLSPVLKLLGSIQGKMGNKALAVSYFEMSLEEAYRINSPRWINESFTALAQYSYDVNQIDSSLVYARKAIAAVKNTPFSNKSIKPAKLLLDIYENSNSDSAIKYFKIYKAANDSLFSAQIIQQTQVMSFEDELLKQQAAEAKIRTEEDRKQNIQYVLIALGIITFIILYLLLSRSFITNTKLIEYLGVIALLIVFEFINLLLHPFLERVTNHSLVIMLLALVCIAALLVPLHHKAEKWATARLIEKNKRIRLAAARKTIEQLEA